jgi:hypothetical protein
MNENAPNEVFHVQEEQSHFTDILRNFVGLTDAQSNRIVEVGGVTMVDTLLEAQERDFVTCFKNGSIRVYFPFLALSAYYIGLVNRYAYLMRNVWLGNRILHQKNVKDPHDYVQIHQQGDHAMMTEPVQGKIQVDRICLMVKIENGDLKNLKHWLI